MIKTKNSLEKCLNYYKNTISHSGQGETVRPVGSSEHAASDC